MTETTPQRPQSSPPPAATLPEASGSRWLLELVAFLALGLGLVAVFRAWPELPERVPMHFDLSGRPDGWGGRASVLLLPGVALFVYVMLSAVQRLPERWYNYPVTLTEENRAHQHRLARGLILALKAALMGLFAHMTLAVLRTALGHAEGLGPWLVIGWLVLIFGLVGAYLVRAVRAR